MYRECIIYTFHCRQCTRRSGTHTGCPFGWCCFFFAIKSNTPVDRTCASHSPPKINPTTKESITLPCRPQSKKKQTISTTNAAITTHTKKHAQHKAKRRGGAEGFDWKYFSPNRRSLGITHGGRPWKWAFWHRSIVHRKKISAFGGVGWRPITIRQVLPATACFCSGAPPRVGQRMQRALSYGYSFPPGARTCAALLQLK